jgi:hypothetical protein
MSEHGREVEYGGSTCEGEGWMEAGNEQIR